MSFDTEPTEPALPTQAFTKAPKMLGPYEVIALLHRGGMSLLYLGLHVETKKLYAIKFFPKEHVYQEANLLKMISHPHIVRYEEQGSYLDGCYIVMEWIQGISLRTLLQHHPLSFRRTIEILLQIMDALHFLHEQGIMHLDIKLDNLMLTKQGCIKLVDFGLASLSGNALRTPMHGTPSYMSPEQKKTPPEASFASDIYSLGVLAYELFTGKVSFGVMHLIALPPLLRAILQKALAISPSQRYASIAAFRDALQLYQSSIDHEKPPQDAKREILEMLERQTSCLRVISPEPRRWGATLYTTSPIDSAYVDYIHVKDGSFLACLANARDPLSVLSMIRMQSALHALLSSWDQKTPLSAFLTSKLPSCHYTLGHIRSHTIEIVTHVPCFLVTQGTINALHTGTHPWMQGDRLYIGTHLTPSALQKLSFTLPAQLEADLLTPPQGATFVLHASD